MKTLNHRGHRGAQRTPEPNQSLRDSSQGFGGLVCLSSASSSICAMKCTSLRLSTKVGLPSMEAWLIAGLMSADFKNAGGTSCSSQSSSDGGITDRKSTRLNSSHLG